jgi:hypothetical protein
MKVEEIPQEIIDILDEAAGKKHSKEGNVLNTLAKILTKYDELCGFRI